MLEGMIDSDGTIPVVQRYSGKHVFIEQIVMEVVRDQLNRRQGTDNITRSFLKFFDICLRTGGG